MNQHKTVARADWLDARRALLAKEKEFTRLRDELSQERRDLPWVKIDKDYVFDGPDGETSLVDLFGARSQLVVYHFMYGPDWTAGCKSCSFWADNFNGIVTHLNHRDVSLAAISRAPLAELEKFKTRMGWSFDWLSSAGNDFNQDFGVSFSQEDVAGDAPLYNFATQKAFGQELPGISVFTKNAAGEIFHTYSCYSRGLDMMNTAYHYLDLVPKGRDEDGLPYTMAWLKLRDEYAA